MPKLVMTAAFSVAEDESKAFQEWMEKVHFPDMHKTGCFVGPSQKTLSIDNPPGFVNGKYSHEIKDEEAWKLYNETKDFRPALKEYFNTRNRALMVAGKLKLIMTVGYEEVI